MLKANVGLSRKISKDYNSSGYTVNIEGEIAATPDDSEAVLERIKELWSVAEETLAQEIDRDQGEQAIASRDEEPAPPKPAPPNGADRSAPAAPPKQPPNSKNGSEEPATNKQVQFLVSLSKRLRMSQVQLEAKIETVLGRPVRVYELTKRQAGVVLDALTQKPQTNGGSARKS